MRPLIKHRLYLVAVAGILLAVELSPAQSFRFFVFGDPQVGMFPLDLGYNKGRKNLAVAVAAANSSKPAFVLVCGDMVNEEGNARQIAAYRVVLSGLDSSIAVHHAAGNHDVGNVPTPQSLTSYRVAFGPDWYSFEYDSVAFIIIDSPLIKDPSRAPGDASAQDEWLLRALADFHQRHFRVMVVQHHPWFLKTPEEADQYFNLPRSARDRWLPLFDSLGVTHVFSGHLHHELTNSWRKIRFVSSGPVGMPLGPDPSGLRLVSVSDTSIIDQYIPLRNLPDP